MNKQFLAISYIDLLQMVVIVICFFILASIQKVILKESYTTIQDAVYYRDINNFFKTYSFRVLIIIGICLIFSIINGFNTKNELIYIGIGSAGFLQIWAAIMNYHLLKFPINKEKGAYLFFLLLYLFANLMTVWLTINLLFPIFRSDMEIYLLDNTGVHIVFTLISFSVAGGIEYSLSKKQKREDYISIESFQDETRILERQINLEMGYLRQFENGINRYSKRYDIPENLIYGIIALEHLNRGSLITRLVERVVCTCMPNFAIDRDISIGISQIKISRAKEIIKQDPNRFLKKLCNPNYNIFICAKILKDLDKKYNPEIYPEYHKYIILEYMGYYRHQEERLLTLYSTALKSFCENFKNEDFYY